MSKRRRILFAVLLLLSIANFERLAKRGNVSVVEFLSIFAIGAFSALLIREIVALLKAKDQ